MIARTNYELDCFRLLQRFRQDYRAECFTLLDNQQVVDEGWRLSNIKHPEVEKTAGVVCQ